MYKLVAVRPVLHENKCRRCGKCADACPLGAIKMEDIPVIDEARCLNCYVCSYRCPGRAMRLRGISFLNGPVRFLRKLVRL